jgi:hypothetical protein
MGCEHTPGLGVLPLEPCPLLFFKIECYSVFILQKKKKKKITIVLYHQLCRMK